LVKADASNGDWPADNGVWCGKVQCGKTAPRFSEEGSARSGRAKGGTDELRSEALMKRKQESNQGRRVENSCLVAPRLRHNKSLEQSAEETMVKSSSVRRNWMK